MSHWSVQDIHQNWHDSASGSQAAPVFITLDSTNVVDLLTNEDVSYCSCPQPSSIHEQTSVLTDLHSFGAVVTSEGCIRLRCTLWKVLNTVYWWCEKANWGILQQFSLIVCSIHKIATVSCKVFNVKAIRTNMVTIGVVNPCKTND